MINKLDKLVNNKMFYNHLIKYLPLLSDINIEKLHFSNNISMNTFEGKLACGASSYLLYFYIKKYYDINLQFKLSTFGYGKYKEDHLYLTFENYVIDPTYKQFVDNKDISLPFVLIENDLPKYLNKYKINEEYRCFWLNPINMTEKYNNKNLNQIIITDTIDKRLLLDSLINFNNF